MRLLRHLRHLRHLRVLDQPNNEFQLCNIDVEVKIWVGPKHADDADNAGDADDADT